MMMMMMMMMMMKMMKMMMMMVYYMSHDENTIAHTQTGSSLVAGTAAPGPAGLLYSLSPSHTVELHKPIGTCGSFHAEPFFNSVSQCVVQWTMPIN